MNLIINSPLDMHLHLREDTMLQLVAPLSARSFAGAVIMPNLMSPVDSLQKLEQYRSEIIAVCEGEIFEPYMTLFSARIPDQNFLPPKIILSASNSIRQE